ncbi:Pyrimidine-specific ribonucleoside hydrolase RihA [Candidatus Bilamarchaeum dharawalense]|uniref:Pyrimidine-specific ribonucleoside hydrolase RihA n=1 Tax=Candidatus Bilamarchaeum dharawalense TaxID=2885759 RepID=A0A5E4LSS2_9ARCH|nr:Pyrimidine-specific ribonucleoside hydrolase RihA [Candidatus Bilamarchaeum dharawalense]
MTKTPVILSTDIGSDIDDALNLQIVALSKTFQLLSVIVTHGVLDIRETLTRKMLHNLGRDDVIVAQGAEQALDPTSYPPTFITGFEAVALSKKERRLPARGIDGVELFIKQVHEFAPIVVSIAPMTTIARALEKDSSLAQKIPHLYVMGGSLESSEHNMVHDLAAAAMVFSSGIPTTVLPLEATQRFYHTELTELDGSKNQKMIARMATALRIHRALDFLVTRRTPEQDQLFAYFKKFSPFHPGARNVRPEDIKYFYTQYEAARVALQTTRLPNDAIRSFEQDLRAMELFLVLRHLLQRESWVDDFNGCHDTLTLALNASTISYSHALFEKAFKAGLEDHMGVYDAYIPYMLEHPERVKVDSCNLSVDKVGKLHRESGASHNLVVDVDHEHFKQFLRQRLRADQTLRNPLRQKR